MLASSGTYSPRRRGAAHRARAPGLVHPVVCLAETAPLFGASTGRGPPGLDLGRRQPQHSRGWFSPRPTPTYKALATEGVLFRYIVTGAGSSTSCPL
jgi:hypothetical protein